MQQKDVVLLGTPEMANMVVNIHRLLSTQVFGDEPIATTVQILRIKRFPDGIYDIQIPESVRGKSVCFFACPQHPDPGNGYMNLFIANDALLRAGAQEVSLYLPYMPGTRQDRKDRPRVAITAKQIFRLIASNQVIKNIVTLDIHAEQIQGYVDLPFDNWPARKIHAQFLREYFAHDLGNVALASPDIGGMVRVERLGFELEKRLPTCGHIPLAFAQKRRDKNDGTTRIVGIAGDVAGKDVVLYDDMIDRGDSSIKAGKRFLEQGARSLLLVCTHPVFSKSNGTSAETILRESGFKVVAINTIPRPSQYLVENQDWLTILPCDETLAEVIYRTQTQKSVSEFIL